MAEIIMRGVLNAYPEGVDWSTVDYDWSTVDSSPLARVQRGMSYLIATYGEAVSTVDLRHVHVGCALSCPLALVARVDYFMTIEAQTMGHRWLHAHGFLPGPLSSWDVADDETWSAELDELWYQAFEEVHSGA